jgi:hypothetical protein
MSHQPSPGPAVEVVATLGDSVVGVRHVTDPRGGATRPVTRALLIGGALAVTAGAIAFFAATQIAEANQAALTAWIASKRPAWSFRPEAVPMWISVVSFLGFSLGLTAIVNGLSRRRRELEPATVSVGTAANVDFAVGGTMTPSHALVAPHPQGTGFVLDLTGMTGEITGPDGTQPITPMAAALPVTPGLRVRAQLGMVGFHVAAIEPPRRQTTPVLAFLDRRTLGFLAASAAAHMALWAVARTVPPDAASAQVDFLAEEDVTMRLASITTDDMPPPVPEPTEGDVSGEDGTAAMILEQGTIGDMKDRSLDPATRRIRNKSENPELARRQALEQAASAGVLGSSLVQDGDMFASVVGTGLVSSGFDDADIAGAIAGDGEGAPAGFGQNASGNSFGGGGTSFRVGGYNTIRDGKRIGEGFGIPGAHGCKATTGVCRPHIPKPPVVIGPPKDVTGDYDGAIIKRYVKRKLPQISYCYEQQLIAKPSLEGTVMATWTINASGLVMESTANGVDDKVASCIATVISTIQFPKPPSIGVFKVRYPFVLHKHGS